MKITTTTAAMLITLAWCAQALADPNLIIVNFDDQGCVQGVQNDEDICPQPSAGRACRRAGQPILWRAAPGPNRPQFTVHFKGLDPVVGCSLTSTPGGTLSCRVGGDVAPGDVYEYGIANTASGCGLDPHIFILR